MMPVEARAHIRQLERNIEQCEEWASLPTSPALSLRIASHLAALRAERNELIRLLVEHLSHAA